MRALIVIVVVILLLMTSPAEAQLVPGGNHGGGGSGVQPGWTLSPGWLSLNGPFQQGNAPEIHFVAQNGEWMIGPDVANNGGGGRDFVIAARVNVATRNVEDVIYLRPDSNGTKVGIGASPPSLDYRLQTGGQGSQGGLVIVRHVGEYGHPFAVADSNGTPRAWIDAEYGLHVPRLYVGGVLVSP